MANKVLFVHDGPLQKDDSGNYYGVTLSNTLKERFMYLGDHVTFMMRTKKIHDEELFRFSKIQPDNFSVIDVPDYKSITKYIKNSGAAKRIIKEAVAQHDIIVVRMPSAIGLKAAQEAKKLGKPLLVEYVACTFDAYWNYNWKGKIIAHYKMYQQKSLVKNVPYIIYVTKQFLQQRYPSAGEQTNCSNVEINSVDKNDLVKRIEKINSGTKDKALVLGTVAAINVPYKGHDDVFRAIAVLKLKEITVKYRLVGHGSPDRLKALSKELNIQDDIEFIGPIKHSEVFDFYNSLDVYIQPSKQEGLPRSVIEAMSKATPVLGSTVAGIPELLDKEMLFTPGNVNEIVSKIMLLNQDVLKKQASVNINRAEGYTKEVLMARRLDFYRRFLKNYNLAQPQKLQKQLADIG